MGKYIDAEKLITELKRQKRELKLSIQSQGDYGQSCQIVAYENIISLISSLQQEQPEVNKVEKALSLQIQAYLTTASDELYAPGKPLYTKEHHEGIHECMKMWQKLHQYYFSTKQAHPEVDLEKETNAWLDSGTYTIRETARHFYELGLNARKEE